MRYLPRYEESRRAALELGEQEGWTVEHLGQIAQVFNGPRFRRPYADKDVTQGPGIVRYFTGNHDAPRSSSANRKAGPLSTWGRSPKCSNGPRFRRPYADKDVTQGPGIVRYFTGNAATQTRGENIKHLDLGKASATQLKMIDKLYMRRGMILITDSGTVGRVVYATNHHDGAVGTNNLIRVVVEDEALRGYVYQFLLSPMGQNQLRANIYGAIVDHLEPDDVKQVIIPLPWDRTVIEAVGNKVIEAVRLQEAASDLDSESMRLLRSTLALEASAGSG